MHIVYFIAEKKNSRPLERIIRAMSFRLRRVAEALPPYFASVYYYIGIALSDNTIGPNLILRRGVHSNIYTSVCIHQCIIYICTYTYNHIITVYLLHAPLHRCYYCTARILYIPRIQLSLATAPFPVAQ